MSQRTIFPPYRNPLYPELEPYDSGLLTLDALHTMYWEECGNPKGVPILFLHGGPGSGCSATNRRFFDPSYWRIILFDQRGSGRSTPLGETRANTTEHLVADIEVLRDRLGIQKWHVFGGSWGSTLALAYAQTHPAYVSSLILRGIFLMQPHEINWFLSGLREIYPEAWNELVKPLSAEERSDIASAYIKRFNDPNADVRREAARRWSAYETYCSRLYPDTTGAALEEDRHAIGRAVLEAHYFSKNLFQPHDALLQNVNRIRHIPTQIIHGRYDMICPIRNAFDLVARWPEAVFTIVADAGHASIEPGICHALIEATDNLRVR